jgi:hypothetical protein
MLKQNRVECYVIGKTSITKGYRLYEGSTNDLALLANIKLA